MRLPNTRRLELRARISTIMALCGYLVLVSTSAAWAQADRPFPQAKITAEQWQHFFEEVKTKPGIKDVSSPNQADIIRLEDEAGGTMYYFTNGGPAHPAVVIEKLVQTSQGINLETTGYFAGAEEPFAKWFNAFQARAAAIRQQMKQGR